LIYALYEALVGAPTEQTMGNVQRIFYYHVPSAWTAFILFFVNFGASIFYLIKRNRRLTWWRWLRRAKSASCSCTVVLITGPIWARPVWGIWWTWDMRLTSTLVMWLIYVSYLVAAALLLGRGDADIGGCPGGSGRALHSVCLLFDLVFSHAASAAGYGRRRID
jgi:heme exporter protein C